VQLVEKELPVDVILPPGFEGSQNIAVRPPTVLVTMPKQVADGLPADAAFVTVRESDLRGGPSGGRKSITLDVELPESLRDEEDVRPPDPARVEVTLDVAESKDSHVLATVPVWVSLPPTQTNKWTVELEDQFLSSVRVSGPSDQIRRLANREIVVKAQVELDTQDPEAQVSQKAVRFVRADGLSIAGLEFPSPPPVVRLRIEPRLEGGAGGPSGTEP
jgi:hypothetical protein